MNQTLFEGHRESDLLRPLKYFADRVNGYLARQHIKSGHPQIAIYSFDYIGLSINLECMYEIHTLNLLKQFLSMTRSNLGIGLIDRSSTVIS